MKTKFLPRLLTRAALCGALAAAVWGGLESLEFAARSENGASASTDIAMASLANVPAAAPWVLQLTALLRGQ